MVIWVILCSCNQVMCIHVDISSEKCYLIVKCCVGWVQKACAIYTHSFFCFRSMCMQNENCCFDSILCQLLLSYSSTQRNQSNVDMSSAGLHVLEHGDEAQALKLYISLQKVLLMQEPFMCIKKQLLSFDPT